MKHWYSAVHSSFNQTFYTARRFSLLRAFDRFRAPYQETIKSDSWFEPNWQTGSQGSYLTEERTRLIETYALQNLTERVSPLRVCETLTTLTHLEALWPTAQQDLPNHSFHWLDVGSKNFAYVEALSAFARCHTTSPLRLTGVELDPHRRYVTGYTRQQVAEQYCRQANETGLNLQARYLGRSVLDVDEPADVITWFLPFLFEEPLLAWGLPLSELKPALLLEHVVRLLKPGAWLLVLNLDDTEAAAQAALFNEVQHRLAPKGLSLDITPIETSIAPSFLPHTTYRRGFRCQRQPDSL